MATVDQEELAQTAKALQVLYEELDEAKYDRPPAPEVSTTHNNRQKGPMCPGPIWAISDDAYFTERLNELACDAASRIEGHHRMTLNGRQLCHWIAWHAGPVSQLDFADDILDEIRWQIRELDHRLRRTRPFVPAGEPQEVWLTARSICYKLRQQGYDVSPELLRKWVERGKLEANKDSAEHNLYRLSKVIQLLR